MSEPAKREPTTGQMLGTLAMLVAGIATLAGAWEAHSSGWAVIGALALLAAGHGLGAQGGGR